MRAAKLGSAWVTQVGSTEAAQYPIGNQLQVAARRNVLKSGCAPLLIEATRDLAGHRGPEEVLSSARYHSLEQNPPGLLRALGEAHALEWHGDLCDPAAIGDF